MHINVLFSVCVRVTEAVRLIEALTILCNRAARSELGSTMPIRGSASGNTLHLTLGLRLRFRSCHVPFCRDIRILTIG